MLLGLWNLLALVLGHLVIAAVVLYVLVMLCSQLVLWIREHRDE